MSRMPFWPKRPRTTSLQRQPRHSPLRPSPLLPCSLPLFLSQRLPLSSHCSMRILLLPLGRLLSLQARQPRIQGHQIGVRKHRRSLNKLFEPSSSEPTRRFFAPYPPWLVGKGLPRPRSSWKSSIQVLKRLSGTVQPGRPPHAPLAFGRARPPPLASAQPQRPQNAQPPSGFARSRRGGLEVSEAHLTAKSLESTHLQGSKAA